MLSASSGRGYSSLPPARRGLVDRLRPVLVAGLVVAAGYYLLQFLSPTGGPSKPPAHAPELAAVPGPYEPEGPSAPPPPSGSAGPPDVRLATAAGVERQALAFAKARQGLAVARADDVVRLADECLAEVAAFDAVAAPLLTSDDGRRVAADRVRVARFRAVREKDRPAKEVAERLRRAAAELAAPVRASQADPKDGSDPGEQVTAELDRFEARLGGMRRAWQQDRQALDALVADARRAAPAATPRTLDEALRADAEAEALAQAADIDRERTRVRQEAHEKMVREAAELDRKIAEARLEKLRAEKTAEATRLQADAGIAAKKGKDAAADERARAEQTRAAETTKAERDRLVQKASTPEVKQTLAAFLEPGYHQPTRDFSLHILLERTPRLEPVSFGRLQKSGALDKTMTGLGALAAIATSRADDKRPRWTMTPYTHQWNSQQQERVQKAQDLLNELGPVMAEEGLLAK